MAEQLPTYERLSGGPVGSVVYTVTLWYTHDHLVCVSSAFGYETYQRVYLRDVEAFITKPTKGRLLWNIVFGTLLAFVATMALLLRDWFEGLGGGPASLVLVVGMLIALGVPGIFALVALIVNSAKGQTCSFWAQTRGGIIRLRAPVRVRAARQVVETLTPLIVEAQQSRPISISAER